MPEVRTRSRWWVTALAVVGALSLIAGVVGVGVVGVRWLAFRSADEQRATSQSAFYSAPESIPPTPGTIIRSEPLEYSVVGGRGFRVVYTSLDSAGVPIAVSGRIFLPDTPAPAGGRRVLAWAHGTVGLAASCAPSGATSYTTTGWLEPALQRGWVVTATDYAGLGMPGPSTYLVGGQEARDVVNSVRAARAFAGSAAGADWVVFGASQGGHAALWTAHEAARLAPELRLRGVAAAVPAAELAAIMTVQWHTVVGWVIGPDALSGWRIAHPDRDFEAALSESGRNQAATLSSLCVADGAVSALVLNTVKGSFFEANPLTDPAWSATVEEETPPPPPAGMPMFLAQGMADKVVLAGSNALLQNTWCPQGVTITSLWLPTMSHQNTSIVAGPAVVNWAADRFAGAPAVSTCSLGVPAPVSPLPR